MKYLIVAMFLVGCGPNYDSLMKNSNEFNQQKIVTVYNIDYNGNWNSFYYLSNYKGKVILPSEFYIDNLTNLETGEYIDLYINNLVFCYKGVLNTKKYSFSYKKISNNSLGCDSNSEKDLNYQLSPIEFISGEKLGIVPRSSNLQGIVFNFSFLTVY